MRFIVGIFALLMGAFALTFAGRIVSASERTRTDVFGGKQEGREASGWRSYSTVTTRLVGFFFVVIGLLVLFGVLDVRS